MFIHIGGDVVVRAKEVITILDVNGNKSEKNAKKNNNFDINIGKSKVVKISQEIKSIIITDDKIYYSPISSLTLKKRACIEF